jgi:hypothetical protein
MLGNENTNEGRKRVERNNTMRKSGNEGCVYGRE